MNADSEQQDNILRQRLQEWRVNTPLPPHFPEQVWRRIEQEESAGADSLRLTLQMLLSRLFARPAWAAGYIAVALVAGMSLGYWHGQERADTLSASLGHRYIQSVDPYQKPRH